MLRQTRKLLCRSNSAQAFLHKSCTKQEEVSKSLVDAIGTSFRRCRRTAASFEAAHVKPSASSGAPKLPRVGGGRQEATSHRLLGDQRYDAIIVGGGHNGLTSAAYLAKHGLKVLVLERRHVVGGAAVTEELIPGFKFSRASYLAGLLRPQVIQDLQLEKHGLKYLTRDPSSFTPTRTDGPYGGKSLILGDNAEANSKSIAQFSEADADNYERYNDFLGKIRDLVTPLLDGSPPTLEGNWRERVRTLMQIKDLVKVGNKNKEALIPFYELFTGPATQILDRWFESEVLKVTLATDAVIGAMSSPSQPGSAYVLLHHVMGEAAGKKGVWAYVEGGMGKISESLASSAREYGAQIQVNASVKEILYNENSQSAEGVMLSDGTKIHSKVVLSNCNPYHTFLELLPRGDVSPLPRDFRDHVEKMDFACGAFKINCAVDKLPNFACLPNTNFVNGHEEAMPHHRCTTHFENSMHEIEEAYREASMGRPASRPVIEMTIPSSVDKTISPPGKHVVQFFVQFAPYSLDPRMGSWEDEDFKNKFADNVFSIVEEHIPGFASTVLGRDVLSPLDLERIFGLHKGNIFHGALSLHQLGYARPAPGYSSHRTPLNGLYICGSGAHPGGGVMGAAGRNCAFKVLSDLRIA